VGVVKDLVVDGPAVDAALFVDLVEVELRRIGAGGAAGGTRTAQRLRGGEIDGVLSDPDLAVGTILASRVTAATRGKQKCYDSGRAYAGEALSCPCDPSHSGPLTDPWGYGIAENSPP